MVGAGWVGFDVCGVQNEAGQGLILLCIRTPHTHVVHLTVANTSTYCICVCNHKHCTMMDWQRQLWVGQDPHASTLAGQLHVATKCTPGSDLFTKAWV